MPGQPPKASQSTKERCNATAANNPMKTAILGMLALMLTVTNAQGQMLRACGERAKMVKMLKDKYKEHSIGIGISNNGRGILGIFASARGSYSAILTNTKGMSCIMNAGHGWTTKELPKGEKS
jgi:hypothetical protein